MSATVEVPRGLDKLTPDEERLMESMRDETPAEPAPESVAAPPAPEAQDIEIDIPDEPEPAAPASGRPQTMVPQQAMHAERAKRKEAEKKAEEAAAKLAALETKQEKDAAVLAARLDMIARVAETQAVPAPAVPPAPVADEPLPDENTDPVGYFKALTTRLQKTVEGQGALLKGFTEQQQQARAVQQLRDWGVAQEQAFMAREPSYAEAMTFLRQSRHDELTEIGIADPAERERIINGDITAIANKARQDAAVNPTVNFGERLFKAAQRRGFAKAAPVAPAAPVVPPLDAEVEPPAVTARAARLAEGRENSTTIGSVGAAPATRLSVQKIADMPEKDFEVFIKRYEGNPAALRELMGD